jgi:hypothetical protein
MDCTSVPAKNQFLFSARRAAVVVMLALLMALTMFQGAAEDFEVQTTEGYFESETSLYTQPDRSSEVLLRIPQYTPLVIRVSADPAQKGFGWIRAAGVSGFVSLANLLPMPRVVSDWREGKTMFAWDVRLLREQSLHGAEVLLRLLPETPFKVLGRTKFMLYVEAQGVRGYVYADKLEELRRDQPLEPSLRYSALEQPLLSWPLAGAQPLTNLKAGQLLRVTGQNRGYLRVETMGQVGYVQRKHTGAIGEVAEQTMLVYSQTENPLYSGVDDAQTPAQTMEPGRLYQVDAQAGDFLRLKNSGLFVRAESVQALLLKAFAVPRLAGVEAPRALMSLPEADSASDGWLQPGRLYTFLSSSGSWWYVDDGMVQGFVDVRYLTPLPEQGEKMNRTYAVYTGDAAYLPGSSRPQPVAPGQLVQLHQLWGKQWFRTEQGSYVHIGAVDILASDAPVRPHKVVLDQALPMYSLPDEARGRVLAALDAGEQVEVIGFARYFLLLRARGMEGYVVGKTLKTHETRYLPDSDPPPCEILVNKADFSVSLYALDAQGQRGGEPVIRGIAALGKRSTPTPSGRYPLGLKQRWVRFSQSQAPHGITYLRGRYLHGIPCNGPDEAEVTDWGLQELGTPATGGCVRMTFDLAAYLYFNCPSYQTIMEVVNGLE